MLYSLQRQYSSNCDWVCLDFVWNIPRGDEQARTGLLVQVQSWPLPKLRARTWMATETAVGGVAAPSSSGTISRRVLRKTLNDALAIASYAVQLDTEGDYARSMEAYQQSVALLDQGISLMQLQRDLGSERPGRDTSHEISQLEQIREKYAARINTHRSERDRKAAILAARESNHVSSNHHHTTTIRRPRTPQGSSIPPPQHPPPSAPLPPIPPMASPAVDTVRTSNDTVVESNGFRTRGASLPSNQTEPTRDSALSSSSSTNVNSEISGASRNGSFSLKSPKTPPPPTPSTATSIRSTNLDSFPVPKKRTKSIGRPQTAPGPGASSPPTSNGSPIRTRTTSGATPPSHVLPKRSNSSTALSSSSVTSPVSPIVQPHQQGPPRLQRFGSSTNIRHGLLSPSPASLSSKRVDLIPLREPKTTKIEVPAFATIYALEPATKVTAPPPPPMPTDPQRHPYHLLRLILGTLTPISSPGLKSSQPTGGGFITPRLYVPVAIWHQPDLWTLVVDLQEKTRLLEALRETLRTVHETSVIHFGHVFFSPLRAPAKLKKTKSSENSLPAIPAMDDPIEWLQSLEKLANVTCEMERSMSKKLGMGENGASVTKKMVDWSTRMAKKTMGGKGPSNELMVAYVDALAGVCAFGAMLDAHLCALRTVLPPSAATRPTGRRPTLSRSNTVEAAKALSASQTNIAVAANSVPDFKSDPDVLPAAATQLIPKYSELPKFVNTQALAHLEKATKVFSSFIIPFIVRDLAILIQGLQAARNGEWMGLL